MPIPKKVQIFKRKDQDLGVRMVFKNGEKMSVSEGYENKSYAKKLAGDLGKALKIKVEDLTKKK